VLFFVSVGAAGAGAATLRWRPEELGSSRQAAAAPALTAGEARVVTFNAWKLFDEERVPRFVSAVEETGRMLAASPSARPEIVAVQEIESREAEAALSLELRTTHWFETCDCDVLAGNELGSAVGLGVARDAFVVREHRCIPLGVMWPDHPRCAIEATVERAEGGTFSVVAVHMAWHPDNEPMARRLVAALPLDEDLLVIGDFNTWQGRGAYDALLDAPLTDARPGAAPTTVVERRVDLILYRGDFEVRRGLDRRASFEALDPTPSLSLPGLPFGLLATECEDEPARCPVSDHLPEGVVLTLPR
jgi:endonuclease/exonuclease/phosphatase family metal-dependent hydrolase